MSTDVLSRNHCGRAESLIWEAALRSSTSVPITDTSTIRIPELADTTTED